MVTCYACEREPTQQCPRCGRPYCDDHGDEVCDICTAPASGVPSFNLYRGSLLALLIGTALAVWLIIQPAGGQSEATPRPREVTPTSITGAGRLTTPAPGQTVSPGTPAATQAAGMPQSGATGTPASGATPAPTATAIGTPATGSGATEYTVASGDTLSGICGRLRPNLNNVECVEQIVRLNNLSSADAISPGQRLRLP
jgi:LysM repeat protein